MKPFRAFKFLFSILLVVSAIVSLNAQSPQAIDKEELRTKTFALIKENRYLDAHPLLEKLAPLYPNDSEVWAHYGIAILARSSTLTSPDERKTERIKGYNVLVKARDLGTESVIALNLLDQLDPDGGAEDNFGGNPDFEKNLREGEAFFGRGEYDKAFVSYQKAHNIDPKSYEALLFMGDALYAAKKYKESEVWFAKAVEANLNREQAYRFWGDALMEQNKIKEAGEKFVDALIADPYSRMTWDRLGRWVDESNIKTSPLEVTPPGNTMAGPISIDEKLLKTGDGTTNWRFYNEVRKSQVIGTGAAKRTLAGELSALRKVADAARKDLKAGTIKYPEKSLTNLLRLDDLGMLEPYVLILRADEDISSEYEAYRVKNREKIKRFVVECLLGIQK